MGGGEASLNFHTVDQGHTGSRDNVGGSKTIMMQGTIDRRFTAG